MNEKLRLAPERHDLITSYSLHLFSVEVHKNCSKIRRHSGKMSVHACNTREKRKRKKQLWLPFSGKLLSKPPLSPISLKEKNLRFIYHTLPLFRPDRHSGKSIAHVLLPNFLNSFLNNLSNNFVKLN